MTKPRNANDVAMATPINARSTSNKHIFKLFVTVASDYFYSHLISFRRR